MKQQIALASAPAAAALIGGLGARNAPEVYGRLRKPRWAPPAAAFGPAWTILYLLIGVAGWRLGGRAPRRIVALHLTQLALNAAWPVVFFSARRQAASLAIIAALDATIAAEIALLVKHDRVAAGLLAPYLAWCGYATALNATVGAPA